MAYLWVTLLGRPGAGKTTVGLTLACSEHFRLGTVHYISGSRLLDEYISRRREGWKEIKEEKDRGRTANPDLTHTLLEERIEGMTGDGVALLDGFPKSLAEIDKTEAVIGGNAIDLAVLLDCPTNECIARMKRRLVCGECGSVADTDAGVEVSSVCLEEKCAGLLTRRTDDDCGDRVYVQGDESAVVLASHFSDHGRLVKVDALAPQAMVAGRVASAIEARTREAFPQSRG